MHLKSMTDGAGIFVFENWLRDTGNSTLAKVLAHLVGSKLPELYPDIFPTAPTVMPATTQGWRNVSLFIQTSDGREYVLLLNRAGANSKKLVA